MAGSPIARPGHRREASPLAPRATIRATQPPLSARLSIAIVLLLITAVAYGTWRMWPVAPPVGEGAALIETEPPGAMVILEGRMLRSPAHFTAIKAGAHSARVMMPGYDPLDVPLKITPGAELKAPAVSLRRSVGGVRVESEPAGCAFEIFSGAVSVKSGTTGSRVAKIASSASGNAL